MSEAPSFAQYIKEIGRGKAGARALSREDARAMFGAVLRGEAPDLALGAILLALRVKGESLDELRGFCEAVDAHCPKLALTATTPPPVVLPSYNGARHQPNLVPLLALLARELGLSVLVHGVTRDPKRVTTAEVFSAMGVVGATSLEGARDQLERERLALVAIDVLARPLARLIELRWVLGVRNSSHTLVKMMNPFACPAVQLCSVTHPEYMTLLHEYFTRFGGNVLLLRASEGEAIANPRRQPRIEWLSEGAERVLVEAQQGSVASLPELPASLDARVTAEWIARAMVGEVPLPDPIVTQVACIALAAGLADSLDAGRALLARRYKLARTA